MANVIVPGQEDGIFLRTGNLTFKQGTIEVYIINPCDRGAQIYLLKRPTDA